MIIDYLTNASRYTHMSAGIQQAFNYLLTTNLAEINPGKYVIAGENLFAIIQEYETMDAADEQMESHKKYIDVQYMIKGAENVGLALPGNQTVSVAYDEEKDFMLYKDEPTFFAALKEGMFMIFYPTDLHMPCIKITKPQLVKKIVVKVRIDWV